MNVLRHAQTGLFAPLDEQAAAAERALQFQIDEEKETSLAEGLLIPRDHGAVCECVDRLRQLFGMDDDDLVAMADRFSGARGLGIEALIIRDESPTKYLIGTHLCELLSVGTELH